MDLVASTLVAAVDRACTFIVRLLREISVPRSMPREDKHSTLSIGTGRRDDARCNEERVYASIHDAVMDHRLPPGTKLTESVFSEYFQVSRGVIRKALFRLAQKNIVELRPNRGAIVARPTIEETRDVFKARRVIEAAIISTVAAAASKEGMRKLKRHLREEEAASRKRDRQSIVRLSGEFHILLASLQDNRVLYDYVVELVSRTTLIVALYESPGSPSCTRHDHRELVNAIADRDVARATRSMNAHLEEIENNLNLQSVGEVINLHEVFSKN